MLLSICVPTYNREVELTRFFNSIDLGLKDYIQIVICDDGSTDETKDVISRFAEKFNILYIHQKNSGRSLALKNAIMNAEGEYVVLMDSDDFFVEGGLEVIIKNISALRELNNDEYSSLLFGVRLRKSGNVIDNIPPPKLMNFLSARADYNLKKDFKEVVPTRLIKQVMYDVPKNCRRVPTSLLWSRIACHSNCMGVPELVAEKEYLPGGMTDSILKLKANNAAPLVLLYEELSSSRAYKSKLYRIRSRLLWGRYSLHLGFSPLKYSLLTPFLFFAIPIYLYDLYRLRK